MSRKQYSVVEIKNRKDIKPFGKVNGINTLWPFAHVGKHQHDSIEHVLMGGYYNAIPVYRMFLLLSDDYKTIDLPDYVYYEDGATFNSSSFHIRIDIPTAWKDEFSLSMICVIIDINGKISRILTRYDKNFSLPQYQKVGLTPKYISKITNINIFKLNEMFPADQDSKTYILDTLKKNIEEAKKQQISLKDLFGNSIIINKYVDIHQLDLAQPFDYTGNSVYPCGKPVKGHVYVKTDGDVIPYIYQSGTDFFTCGGPDIKRTVLEIDRAYFLVDDNLKFLSKTPFQAVFVPSDINPANNDVAKYGLIKVKLKEFPNYECFIDADGIVVSDYYAGIQSSYNNNIYFGHTGHVIVYQEHGDDTVYNVLRPDGTYEFDEWVAYIRYISHNPDIYNFVFVKRYTDQNRFGEVSVYDFVNHKFIINDPEVYRIKINSPKSFVHSKSIFDLAHAEKLDGSEYLFDYEGNCYDIYGSPLK